MTVFRWFGARIAHHFNTSGSVAAFATLLYATFSDLFLLK